MLEMRFPFGLLFVRATCVWVCVVFLFWFWLFLSKSYYIYIEQMNKIKSHISAAFKQTEQNTDNARITKARRKENAKKSQKQEKKCLQRKIYRNYFYIRKENERFAKWNCVVVFSLFYFVSNILRVFFHVQHIISNDRARLMKLHLQLANKTLCTARSVIYTHRLWLFIYKFTLHNLRPMKSINFFHFAFCIDWWWFIPKSQFMCVSLICLCTSCILFCFWIFHLI